MREKNDASLNSISDHKTSVTLFLCGDVMTGRGIDQILPHPSRPRIYESYIKDARDYVAIAENKNGSIPRAASYTYIWGEALSVLEEKKPDVSLINLETAVTKSEDYWKGKAVNYRMHPKNIPVLTVAGIDCCALANNHVLDWGYEGLTETLKTLKEAGIKTAGAGRNIDEALRPASVDIPNKGSIHIFSFGMPTSGVPRSWAAQEDRPGVNFIGRLTPSILKKIREEAAAIKKEGDLLVASIHWGGNWGYEIPKDQKDFAHWLIDVAGFDIIHGHSSHHFKGMETYEGKPVFYGCGDFINDYEGIGGHERYRSDLTFMYFVEMDVRSGRLLDLELVPMKIKNFRLIRASELEEQWMFGIMEKDNK